MGVVPPRRASSRCCARAATRTGALLVLDEVITGFRVARGGAQELLGVRADLTILGKVLGGGLPLAAVAGARELMQGLAPVGETYQAGTLSGNPLATAAGLATLRELGDEAYARLDRITDRLARGLRTDGVHVTSETGLLTVFFAPGPVTDYAAARGADPDAFTSFWTAMLDRGIYLPPSPFEAWFPSLAHTDEQIERTIEAAAESFEVAVAA